MTKIDEDKYKKALLQRIEGYASGVRGVFQDVMEKLILLALEVEPIYDVKSPFVFSDYPTISDRANVLLRELYSRTYQHIQYGVINEWEQANLKSDELVRAVFGKNAADNEYFARYFGRNKEAMDSFFSRKSKDSGLNLSQRIWKYEGQFRQEMEMAIDCHIGQGTSANTMATQLKQYLNEPDKLFRRVRNERGELALSKNAKAYHPGRGQYRSSYRNAQRLARTETNIAYRTADHERWMQLDFVVGIEVKLSKNHPVHDICDAFAGKYPKEFKFTGWHPSCMCHAISILATDAEIGALTDKILAGEDISGFKSKNEVKQVPDEFLSWMKQNEDRIKKAASLPYFIKDNNTLLNKYSA